MENQVLSIEQMQELIDMGIDVSKASMYISEYGEIISNVKICELEINWTPTLTIQDILFLLPEELPVKSKSGFTYYINITPSKSKSIWNVSYEDVYEEKLNGIKFVGVDWLHIERNESLLTACFNMLKWCKENKYI